MSISSNLTKLTTDITNAYTSIENKGGTIPADKNTNNLSTAIDSIEVIEQATAEGESLSLANTKAMPYSDYVVEGKSEQNGEPSPSIPSEIHSVADDVNLFDIGVKGNYRSYTDGSTINWLTVSNDKLSIVVQADGTTMFYNSKQYLGNKTYTITAKTSMARGRLYVKLRNSSDTGWLTNNDVTISSMSYNSYYGGWFIQSETNTTLILTINIPDCLYCCFGFGFASASDNVGTTQTIQEIKIQEGTVATPYSPYNQGTVTIKQRGKNLWTSNLPIIFSGGSSIVQDNNNGGIDMTIASNASLGYIYYDLGLISDFVGKTLTFSISNEPNVLYKYCAFMACNADGSNRQELKNFYENNQITYTIGNSYSQTHLAIRLYISEGTPNTTYSINNVQVEEGTQATPYEPYFAKDYTIQTDPLRSLPNGVKDTIEEDGIHRRVGRIVLNGSETGWYKQDNTSYSQDYLRFTISITDKINAINPNSQKDNILSDKFTNKILDNNATRQSNSITGQYSTNLINIFIAQSIIIGNDVNSFKTWLSNNPTEVIYELAEEIIEPLTQNQATTMLDIIKTGSYEGTTNIYTDEDVKPTIGVEYYKKG